MLRFRNPWEEELGNAVTYLFPLLALGALVFSDVPKDKVLGVIAEELCAGPARRVAAFISPGESGHDVRWVREQRRARAWYWPTKWVPLLKLVWPMTVYSLLVTDRSRELLATETTFGGFASKEGHERGSVRSSELVEEKQN